MATGHMKDPVPLITKRRGLSPGGRLPFESLWRLGI